ncbi:chloride channel protein [Pelagibius litoralis]|uniref:Chloride channel protein n=1 Tax=Pelagibius litoralis TaxID=374515 RepID=A0A967CBX4_9PROT|nr:chloride channel protein [Pelagibius litoralis]NIA68668.1 chloride channel protein [Pelagibius litoralis]
MRPGRVLRKRVVIPLLRFGRNDQVVLSVLAVVIGAAAGGAAIAFRDAIAGIQWLVYGFGGEQVASEASGLAWWHLLLVPTLGGLAIGLFIRFALPDGKPQGVAHVMEASALRDGRMSLTVGIRAAVASAASIGFGASVGREGPVVHLGACLGSWVAKRLHLGRVLARTLLGCGVAAGVAASFNAPIAGTFFALEVVVGHYALSAFAPIVIASVTGTLISRARYGDFPAFILPENWSIVSFWEFPAFALLGLVSAVAAILFMRSIIFTEDVVGRLAIPSWSGPAFGGFLLGCIALQFPQVLGVGYEATDAALSNLYPLWLLLALIVAKAAATAICLGSGFAGGVFSPSLFIGAMVGGAYGVLATQAFPDLSSGHGAYTIIGMGAVTGAVLGAPISTILMIFEMTNDYELTIAVMLATVIASVVTQQVHGQSFFLQQLERRGVSLRGGHQTGLMRRIKISSVMDDRYSAVAPDTPIAQVRLKLQSAPWGELFVVEEDGSLCGVITYADLHEAAFDTSHDSEIIAANVARAVPAVLQIGDHLEAAVKVYNLTGEPHVPVVTDKKSMLMRGLVHEHQVMLAYQRALDLARAEERGEATSRGRRYRG